VAKYYVMYLAPGGPDICYDADGYQPYIADNKEAAAAYAAVLKQFNPVAMYQVVRMCNVGEVV